MTHNKLYHFKPSQNLKNKALEKTRENVAVNFCFVLFLFDHNNLTNLSWHLFLNKIAFTKSKQIDGFTQENYTISK